MDDGPFDPSFYLTAKCQIANLDILKVCTVKGFKNSDRYHNCIHYRRSSCAREEHHGAFAG